MSAPLISDGRKSPRSRPAINTPLDITEVWADASVGVPSDLSCPETRPVGALLRRLGTQERDI